MALQSIEPQRPVDGALRFLPAIGFGTAPQFAARDIDDVIGELLARDLREALVALLRFS